MSRAPLRRTLAMLALGAGASVACRGPGNFDDEASGSSTKSDTPTTEGEEETEGGPLEFDPLICGTWNPPVATLAGTLPPAQDCAGTPQCFTEVALASGLGTTQYVETHPIELECIFPRPTGTGLNPRQDCEPQWFTGGVSVADVDGDGWPDIFATRLAAPDHLFLNKGDGSFVDVAAQVGLGECSYTNGSVWGDIDNDGDLDLFVTSVGEVRHRLWINQLVETGELGFVDEAEERGFALRSGSIHSGESVTLGDYDRDGWLDVHVNEWIRVEQMPKPGEPDYEVHGSRLLHNLGDGYFEDVTVDYGLDLYELDEDGIFAFSSTFIDIDGDGWQDLSIAIDFHRSRIFWNDAGQDYVDGTAFAQVNRESNAMGSTWADVDRDGDLDWFVTSIAELDEECDVGETPPCWAGSGNRLYSNDFSIAGERSFSEVTDAVGVRDGAWAWGTVFFDADNDGDQDLALGNGWPGRDLNGGFYHADTPTRLWINEVGPDQTPVMTEQGEARGVFDKGQGRGIVSFDYDRDGDLDLLLSNHAGPLRLFRNDGGNANAWLRIAVVGTESNRDGRGAKVRVQAVEGGEWQIREVGVGSHFLGEGELIQHFGVGDAGVVFRVEVEWPVSGIVQSFDGVGVGQTLVVVEGE